MMRSLLLFGCALLTLASTLGAEDLEIYGYFENEFFVQRIQKRNYAFDYNKLRLDAQKRLSEQVFFGANVDYLTYAGHIEYSIADFLPVSIPDDVESLLGDGLHIAYEDTIFVDNAFVVLSPKIENLDLDITVGRQQLSFGSGYAWNPTDMFNVKDIFDPTYEQPGHDAIRLDADMGFGIEATSIVSSVENTDRWVSYARLKRRFGHFDVAGVYGDAPAFRTTVHSEPYTYIWATRDNRKLYGGDIVGELMGVGVWAEGAYNTLEFDDDYIEIVAGGDYTFSFQTYVLAEYYHYGYEYDSATRTDKQHHSLNDWLRLLNGEIKQLSNNYLFAFVQHPVNDLVNAGLFSIINLDDNSAVINPQIIWYCYPDVELTFISNIPVGSYGTEFGSNDPSGLLRLRASF